MAHRGTLKKYAKQIQSKGRFGDTELVHINKDEERLLERYRGAKLSRNPETGVKEAFPWLAVSAGLKLAGMAHGAFTRRKQRDFEKKEIKRQAEERTKALEKSISAAKQISPAQAQAMARMRRGAQEGTMDVEGLTRQQSQPIYQQGQAQTAQAMGQITSQGLEGSIIAQEASRKVGADTRAAIAEQARQIAFQNEQTKVAAEQSLQQALLKRGELLSNLALKRTEGLSQIEMERAQAERASLFGHRQARRGIGAELLGLGSSYASTLAGAPENWNPIDLSQEPGG